MSLREQQDFLARLYTDAGFAAKFFERADSADLLDIELQDHFFEIATAAREEVEIFARSLISKRSREVEKLLPWTSSFLSDNYRPLFEIYSQTFKPTSTKKHLEDAIRFAEFVAASADVGVAIKDVATFESARLGHYSYQRRLTGCFLGHDLRELLKRAPSEKLDLRGRKSIAIWISLGSRTRFVFL
jgi:hypothetical protein